MPMQGSAISATPVPTLPTLFVSHGAPTIALEDGPAQRVLAGLAARLERPRAVLMLSAHWEAAQVTVIATPTPPTVHDFFGFPAPLYALRYPAPGAPGVARRIAELLAAAGYRVGLDATRGFDHGAWVPLRLIYPDADVPVLQLAIDPAQSAAWHWRLGRCLRALCDEGVLVIGSGSMTHNLRDFWRHRDEVDAPVAAYAEAFTTWFAEQFDARAIDSLLAWRERAPEAARAHPTDEHLLPLYVALGAAGIDWSAQRLHHGFTHGAIAMDIYLFQPGSAVGCASPDPFNA